MDLLDGSVSSVDNSQFWSERLRTVSLIDGTLTQQGPEWVCLVVLSAQWKHSQLLVRMFLRFISPLAQHLQGPA